MPVKKSGTSRTRPAKRRTRAAKRSPKSAAAGARRPKPSRKSRRKSGAKIHQGVGLKRGKPQADGLTRAAETIGAAIGATVGMMDSAVHSAAVFGERELATAAHEVQRFTKKLHPRQPNHRRTQ